MSDKGTATVIKKKSEPTPAKSDNNGTPKATYNVTGGKKANAVPAVLPIKNIHVIEGFNPRQDMGDIAELIASIKRHGVQNPVTVRPQKGKANNYELIAGEARLTGAKKADLTEIPVVIRFDLDDELDAKAYALAENSEDGRHPLSALDQAKAFKQLEKKGWSPAKIASNTGTHSSRVNRCLKLLELSDPILDRFQKDEIGLIAALEVGKADPEIQKKVLDEISGEDATEKNVRAAIKRIAKAEGAVEVVGKEANRTTGRSRDASLVVWKSKKDMSRALVELCHVYVESAEDQIGTDYFHECRGSIAVLFWACGKTEQWTAPIFVTAEAPDPAKAEKQKAAFEKLIQIEAKKWAGEKSEEASEGDEDAEDEEKLKTKKDKKKPAKKKKSKKSAPVAVPAGGGDDDESDDAEEAEESDEEDESDDEDESSDE